jgi:hypothetical protein
VPTYRIIGSEVFELSGECNPEKCDAWCCRHMLFETANVNIDDKKYFELHGCEVVESGGKLLILVRKDCEMLDSLNLKCKCYEDRPKACVKYAKRFNDIFFSLDCTLKWKKVMGYKAQKILSNVRKGVKSEDITVFV